jgi:hypothetical protein
MTIRLPIDPAAAAVFAECAVELVPTPPARRQVRFADAPFTLIGAGKDDIRVTTGPGFIPAGTARKFIPGQTYH